jgi:hypothetical protein
MGVGGRLLTRKGETTAKIRGRYVDKRLHNDFRIWIGIDANDLAAGRVPVRGVANRTRHWKINEVKGLLAADGRQKLHSFELPTEWNIDASERDVFQGMARVRPWLTSIVRQTAGA